MNYSCCIEMLFTKYDFVQRIYKAKEAGFSHIEFWCWQDKDIPGIKKALAETGMQVGIFQGNIEGRMVDENDRELFIEGVRMSIETAKELDAKRLFLMSDMLRQDRSVLEPPYPISPEQKMKSTEATLRALLPIAQQADITLLIEPLNTKVDHRGYSLCHSEPAAALIRWIGDPHIRLLFDAYHMQIMEGNIIETIRREVDTFGYFHVADVPGRMEPGTGELNYGNILRALAEAKYDGIVGFEFSPSGEDDQVLKDVWARIK